jgi:branched-chain amino acid transport system substrate-binding protein
MTFRRWAGLAPFVAAFLATAALAADPGVTDTEITIGQTGPYSGPASLAAPQIKSNVAYFKMLNEKGGINGRKVNLISLDDGYAPAKAVELTRELVEQDHVLLIFSQVGTAVAAANSAYLNAKKIPQLMTASGASRFANPKAFPWTVGTAASYRGEARLFGAYLAKNEPDAKIGILYQNDDLGKDYLNGVAEGLGDLAAKAIVSRKSFDIQEPTLDSQIIDLKASGADTVVLAGTARPMVLAIRKIGDLGWKPQILLSLAGTSVENTLKPAGLDYARGVISTTVYKDPSDTRWKDDPEYVEYVAFMKKYLPDLSPYDVYAVSGYISAQVMAKVLTDAGNDLSRENILKTMTSLTNFRPKMSAPAVSFTITPDDYDMFKKLQFMRFNGQSWEPFDAKLD